MGQYCISAVNATKKSLPLADVSGIPIELLPQDVQMLDRSYTLSLEFPHSMSTGYPQTKNIAASEVGVSNILRLRYTFAYLRSWEAHRSQLRERNSQDDQMACPYRSRIVCPRDIHTSTRRAALETWQIKPQPFRNLLSAQQRGVSGGNAKCRAAAKS